MKLNNLILVPVDFSDVCRNAADYAVHIANEMGFTVFIYHVINKDTQALFRHEPNLHEAVERELNGLAESLRLQFPVTVNTGYEEGSIFDLIHKKAGELGANLIVLGTHGKKGFQKLFGSYAMRVITQAQAATLVVQNRKFTPIRNVLMPVNSFTEARQKVQYAIAVHRRFGATIHLYKDIPSEEVDRHRIEVITKQITDKFKSSGVPFTVYTAPEKGESVETMMKAWQDLNIDLVMILTEAKPGTTLFSLSPWSEKILFNKDELPVLCINPVETGQVYFDL
ncbi:MAG: hypothetical protein Kow00127_03410 [Bacteroidales bacterium]